MKSPGQTTVSLCWGKTFSVWGGGAEQLFIFQREEISTEDEQVDQILGRGKERFRDFKDN